MESKQTVYIVGGIGVLAVLVLVMRKGGSSPTVISSGPATGSDPNQVRLAQSAINADIFKTLAGFSFGNQALKINQGTQLAQIEAGRTLGLAQTSAAKDVAAAQNVLQGQAINAARDVGIAQASADTLRAQMYNEAVASQQNAQNRSNLLNGLMSQIGNVLRSIGAQQPRPTASGGSSGGSSGGGAPASTTRQPTRAPLNPNVPLIGQDLLDPFWNFDPSVGGPFDFAFPDYFGGGFDNFGDPPAMDNGNGSDGFYVEDPTFSGGDVANIFDQLGGYYTEPITGGFTGGGNVFDDSYLGEPPPWEG